MLGCGREALGWFLMAYESVLRSIRYTARRKEHNRLGFWETHGYHRRGDPWREERYRGD
jgi:DMSO/TMAO reductase YedYZ molybdopterin-dependent catalytic subunit